MSPNTPDYDPSLGYAFLTLSLLIDGDQIDSLVNSCGGPKRVWWRERLADLQTKFADTQALQRAIDPMFDDIADRDRKHFVKDFLLDTPNRMDGQPEPASAHGLLHNVCAEVKLSIRDKALSWTTEGTSSTVELDGPVEFGNVLCRAFWMVHSNGALSYHLSFEVPFERDLAAHYGLSMLLKAFHPTENTEWVLEDKGWLVEEADGRQHQLLAFIEGLFEGHSRHLFNQLAARKWIAPELVPLIAERAWQRLVLRDAMSLPSMPSPVSSWKKVVRRRLLVLIRDESLFDIIGRVRKDAELVRTLRPPQSRGGIYDAAALKKHFHDQAEKLAARVGAPTDALNAGELAAAVFLSGFSQNIVDFLEQDDLEVHDGISPLYPTLADAAANDGYVVYATPKFVLEVVSSSRSLDRAGRRWLGTCPYLFLVHVMALHNEDIVHTYEGNVAQLVCELEDMGISSVAISGRDRHAVPLMEAFERIRQFRLLTFEQVHKHLSFNVFRYETEQTFFQRIQHVRGTVARREYWEGVLEHLTETVDALKEHRMASYGLRLAWLGFVLALSGALQVWFGIFPATLPLFTAGQSVGIGLALALLLALGFLVGTRRWFDSSTGTSPKTVRNNRKNGQLGHGPE